jgi:type IX secretion system PorP/SprF family membrane protein
VKLKIYISIFLIIPLTGYTQDIHWSHTNENALYQNPANSGFISEDYRITLTTRDQWRSVTKPFQTQAFTFDMVNKFNRKLGYGGSILHDVTGDGIFRTIEGRINVAYTFLEAKNQKYKLRIGLDIGWKNNQMNFSNYMFDNQFDGFIYSSYIPSNEKYTTQQKSNLNVGTGLLFNNEISDKFSFIIGTAIFNINKPNQGFYNVNVPRYRRFNNYIQGIWSINNKMKIYPTINFTKQNSYSEIIIGAKCTINLSNTKKKNELLFGIYSRNKDALLTQIGLKINRLTTSINYDVNTSKLVKASNGRGALEINVQYLWSRKPENNLMHKKCLDYL